MHRLRYVALASAVWIATGCAIVATTPSATRDCTASPDPNAIVDWCTRWRSVGYELHITKATAWLDTTDMPIAQSDWEAYARTDSRLIEDGYVDWADTGRAIGFVWQDPNGPSFVWREGQINVKGIRNEAEISEIVKLARGLSAIVQGDDGETYAESGRPQ